MATRLALAAINYNFRMASYLYKIPITWNSERKQFTGILVKKSNWREFAPWLFTTFVVMGLSMWCAGYVIIRQLTIPKQNLNFVNVILCSMILLVGATLLPIVALLLKRASKSAEFSNIFIRYIRDIENDEWNYATDSKRNKSFPIWMRIDGKVDTFGICMMAISLPLPFIPIICTTFGIAKNMAVYQYFFEDIIPSNIYDTFIFQLLFKTASAIVSYFIFADGCRIYPIMVIFLLVPSKIGLQCMQKMKDIDVSKKENREFVYKIYRELQLIFQLDENLVACIIFLSMTSGALFSATMNFSALRLFHSGLPVPYILFFAFVSMAVLIVIKTILPSGVNMHEYSQEGLVKWISIIDKTTNIGSFERKYLVRRFKALRTVTHPAGLYGFNFFNIKKSVSTAYPSVIMDWTINLLFWYPLEEVEIEYIMNS